MLNLINGQKITFHDQATTDSTREEINQLFHRNLNVGAHGIPTLAEEADVAKHAPGFPAEIIVSARHGGRLVGALLMNVSAARYQGMHAQRGEESARAYVTRWRTLNRMVVLSDYRGNGVGSELLRRAENLAKSSKAVGYDGFAEDSPEQSWSFYERHGCQIMDEGAVLPPLGGIQFMATNERIGRFFWKRLK